MAQQETRFLTSGIGSGALPGAREATQFEALPQYRGGDGSLGSSRRPVGEIMGRVGLYAAIIAICVYSFFPIYWMILSSLRPPERLFLDSSLIFWPPDFSSYSSLLKLTNYPQNFFNSMVMAAATCIVATTLSAFIAYGATRLRFRGKTMLVSSMLFAYMFPPLMLAIPMSAVFAAVGLFDTLWALFVAHLAVSLPLAVWLLWGFFKSMPFVLISAES